jgi:hypothetical protein
MRNKLSTLAFATMVFTLSAPAFGVPAASLTLAPTALNFGNVTVGAGSSRSQQLVITNVSSVSVTIAALPISGGGAGSFAVGGARFPMQLAPKASVNIMIAFTPASAGAERAAVGIASVGHAITVSPSSVPLSGTGVTLTLGRETSSLAYGSVLVDPSTPPTQTATVTNTGTGNVTVSGIAINGGSGAYSATSNPAAPFTLAPNQTAAVAVTFNPLVGGPATGQVSIVSNATNSPSVISLTGMGLPWVSLNWTPSVSPGIIGYNIYEGTVSGGPYVRLWSLAATPAYEDTESGLAPGSTHYYVVTAVDDTGLESSYSNEASVLIS